MARSSDSVKKIMRFKLQLTDTAEPATILKILQKLKDLDITLDVLVETGIGKTVNSLRRHKQAGELAKTLVKGWKKLVPKETISSNGEDGVLSESASLKNKDDDQICPDSRSFPRDDENNNCLTSHRKNGDSSDETPFKARGEKADLQRGHCQDTQGNITESKTYKKNQQENQKIFQKDKYEIQEDKRESSSGLRKKKGDSLLGNKNLDASHKKCRSDSKEKLKDASERGGFGSERESNAKSKPVTPLAKDWQMEGKDSLSSSRKDSKMLKADETRMRGKDERSSRVLRSPEAQNRKKKRKEKKHDTQKYKWGSENKEQSPYRKAKINHKESDGDEDGTSMSFESCLNYDVNALKRKEPSGVKKPSKKMKTEGKEQPKDVCMKPAKLPAAAPEQKPQESLMHLMDVPLPAALPELEKPSSVDYLYERKAEKEADFCDASDEAAVFTGQRLNRKMQVYSGAKTLFLPAMMSLYQQCIRTLQNNINLLYETGGVPFELLEPVLERCTPEQLLRIEEFNPIYVGVTDHLWGKHCQRDFKDFKLQEYESWKEMYIRLSEERERKLKRLTKTIVSAQSKKPQGRQVKMAFIHTVAKPPRNVRIQQEIHGTAIQQSHQLKCSTKVQDNPMRSSYNEPNRSSSASSGGSNTPDPRKKTRVAPMMAKSLKAFRKQLGRR